MKSSSKKLKFYASAFALFLGLGPVYWIPGIALNFMAVLKLGFYLAAILLPFLHFKMSPRFRFPGGARVFFCLILFFTLSIPGVLQGKYEDSLYRLQNNLQIFSLVALAGIMYYRNTLQIAVERAVDIFAVFCCLSFLFMFLIPAYPNPLNQELSLIHSGLGGSRTSWSPAIALYLPWLYVRTAGIGPFAWVSIVGMIGNQVMVAGRTGLVATVIPFFVYGLSRRSYKSIVATIFILLCAYIFAINNLELLRLNAGGLGSSQDLSELSSGRTDQYALGFDSIKKGPIAGVGVGQVTFGESNMLIHNVILRFAAEFGIPTALSIIVLFSIALYRGWRGVARKDMFVTAAFLTVLSGIVGSFFEPFAMFGSFYNAGLWWVSFAICVSSSPT